VSVGAVEVDEALLALKIAFLVLLYLFIWLIVRSATRDIRTVPQESIVLSGAEAADLRARVNAAAKGARLVVLSSPTLEEGTTVEVNGLTPVGRGAENAMRLEGDDYVSSRHATIDARPDGLWIADVGSTNGTFVNGARVTTARLLQPGDVVRIGQTDLQVTP
jgi:pSer/pThr/pTyr-binding forkhead associated (FHA) protein